MPLPNFIIIGAMKAGTTTLHDDLCRFASVYMPAEKEPEGLLHAHSRDKLRRYERCFASAKPGQLIGEASTAYAKRPEYDGIAEAAASILGPELKIIYLLREPISRIVSHYQHEVGLGLETRPINKAVCEDVRYIAFSRYEYQIEPWREIFGPEQILAVQFERYVSRRRETLGRIASFLGIDEPIPTDLGGARNASTGKSVARGPWRKLMKSDLYLQWIKPNLPVGLRDALKTRLLPTAAEVSPEALAPETEAWIRARLTVDDISFYENSI